MTVDCSSSKVFKQARGKTETDALTDSTSKSDLHDIDEMVRNIA